MKTLTLLIPLIMILIAPACHNQQNKVVGSETVVDTSTSYKKTIKIRISKTDKKEMKISGMMVKEILSTSPRYKQLTKGLLEAVQKLGGQSYGIRLVGSPNPKQDNALGYSKTYDYTLYEMYAEREVNTARFTFDPEEKCLYEYDVLNNKLIPIEFDRSLLTEYLTLSK